MSEETPQNPEQEEPQAVEETPAAPPADEPQAEAAPAADEPQAQVAEQQDAQAEEPARPEPRQRRKQADPAPAEPVVPGADLEVDIVPEGVNPLASERSYSYDEDEEPEAVVAPEPIEEVVVVEPIEAVAIDLAAGARYKATGKRKTAIARVILRPGSGTYTINGRTLDEYFPRETLRRNIRQPLETVGYEERMDVVALMEGGGVSAQAGALRHGISRALLEADPNLRGELKRRGFLTRDARAKERKKAGLKKARKRPQFSKR
jgi:small subunit ribosomal protein S9